MKILFISAEVAPFAKRGGLADVVGALPKALHALGHDVRIIMPAYKSVLENEAVTSTNYHLYVSMMGTSEAGIRYAKLPNSEVPVYFVDHQALFNRDEIYGYEDDVYRFTFFSMAALQVTKAIEWKPDVVHAHDWHSAAAVMWLKTAARWDEWFWDMPTVYTIHNLAHQGQGPRDILWRAAMPEKPMYEESEYHVNFMARGIYHANLVNTVSPTYAQEILGDQFGEGLNGLLTYREDALSGILNGLDTEVWNPETDSNLAVNYTSRSLKKRLKNKTALQKRMGLQEDESVPVLGIVSRLDFQKGIDVLLSAVGNLLTKKDPLQIVILGSGDENLENQLVHLRTLYPNQVAVSLAYNPTLAPLIYAGSDIFMMPSKFEPCGLGQLIAMRYGCVPVVHKTGGLADTVHEGVNGFDCFSYDGADYEFALTRALKVYRDEPKQWAKIQRNGMTADFSWTQSALKYMDLYQRAIG